MTEFTGATGVVYDVRMADHKCLWDFKHNEKPERFTSVLKRCDELQLLKRCISIKPREATEEELLKLHTPDMISILKSTENISDEIALEDLSSHYDFLYIHPSTYSLSLLAAGSTVELVSQILDGKIRNGMAIIRPPGHHAMKSEYCGYCFYNNVAIAAQHALDRGTKRILIVDWDIHHGQATQQMFYDDPRVLYFSIHGFQNGAFWPHLRESDYHYIGRGPGMGYNINVPMNEVKMGNSDYLAIFHQLLLPIAYEFNPELIIISAGYDAALGCPEGEMEITPACYSHFTNSLMGLANGRVAVVLEGGYCLKSLSEGAALTMRTLLGDPCPMIQKLAAPTESAKKSILSVMYVLRKYWNCLKHLETFSVKEAGSALNISNNQFWPGIEFVGYDEKPEKYPTRDICPTQDPIIAAELDAQLDTLIADTRLDVPEHHVAFITNLSDSTSIKQPEIIQRCHILSPDRVEPPVETFKILINLIDSLIDEKCRSGIAVAEDCRRNLADILKYAVNKRLESGIERVMFIDARAHPDPEIQKTFQEDSRVLCSSLWSAPDQSIIEPDFVGLNEAMGFTLNLSLPLKTSRDAEVFAAVFRILLPVAYQFGPQLVILATDQPLLDTKISTDCFGQLIHLLTSLAGGRLAVIFEKNQIISSSSLDTVDGLEIYAKALLGDPISLCGIRRHAELTSISTMRTVTRALSPYWSFKFDVQLPDQNVLIPPWINNLKILNGNPELQQL